MIEIISDYFVRKMKICTPAKVRRLQGMVCSLAGVFLNLVMFMLKLIASILTGSVAAAVDAVWIFYLSGRCHRCGAELCRGIFASGTGGVDIECSIASGAEFGVDMVTAGGGIFTGAGTFGAVCRCITADIDGDTVV